MLMGEGAMGADTATPTRCSKKNKPSGDWRRRRREMSGYVPRPNPLAATQQ
jgi:hypothetical protein